MTEPTKEQKIAMYKEAIKILERKKPSLESYTRYYFDNHLNRWNADFEKCTVENFFDSVPNECRLPKAETNLSERYQALYDRFKAELAELLPKTKSKPKKEATVPN